MVKASWRRTKRARSAAFCGAVDAAAGSFEDLTRCLTQGARESVGNISRLGAGQLLERLQHLVLADREQARVGSARVRIAGPARPQDAVDRPIPGRSPARGRGGAEEDDRRRAERGREVRDPGVAAHHAARDGDRRRRARSRTCGLPARRRRRARPCVAIHRARSPLVGAAGDHDPPARAALRGDDARPALRRPAARGRRGAWMDDRGAAGARRGLGRGSSMREVGRIGVDPADASSRHHRATSCSSSSQAGPSRSPQANASSRLGCRSASTAWLSGPRPCRLTASGRARRPAAGGRERHVARPPCRSRTS